MTAMAETGGLPPGFTRFGVSPPPGEQRDYAPGEVPQFTKTISGVVIVTDKSEAGHYALARRLFQKHGLPVTVIEQREMDERARWHDSAFKRQISNSFVFADTLNPNSVPASVRQLAKGVPIMPRDGRNADGMKSWVDLIATRDKLTVETV